MLSALADHASIVLQTANTLVQLRQSEEDARTALGTPTDHLAVHDRSNAVHQQLVHAVLVGGGFAQVATTLAEALERFVTIVDADMRILASSEQSAQLSAIVSMPNSVRRAIDLSRSTGHCLYVEYANDVEVVAAVTAGELYFGAVLLSPGELGSVDDRTIERAAQVAALLTLQQNAVADAKQRVRQELIADVLDASLERRRDLDQRARAHNVDAGSLDTVLVVVVPPQSRAAAANLLASRYRAGGLAGLFRRSGRRRTQLGTHGRSRKPAARAPRVRCADGPRRHPATGADGRRVVDELRNCPSHVERRSSKRGSDEAKSGDSENQHMSIQRGS